MSGPQCAEFLPNAAGEDVVAGIRTPQPLEEMAQKWPKVYEELDMYQHKLEQYYGDMQVSRRRMSSDVILACEGAEWRGYCSIAAELVA